MQQAHGPLGRQPEAPRQRPSLCDEAEAVEDVPDNAGERGQGEQPVSGLAGEVLACLRGDFIRAAGDLDVGVLRPGDEAYLLLHVSALKPRKTSFLDDLNEHQAIHDLPAFTETDLPIERVQAVLRTLPYAVTWRWRVLLPPQGERFIISDRGLCEFGDLESAHRQGLAQSRCILPVWADLGLPGSCTSRSCTAACSGRSTCPSVSR